MQVLHVIHSIDPRSGGPSNSLRELLAAQRSAGLNPSLLCTSAQACEPWSATEAFQVQMEDDPSLIDVELYMGRSYGRRRPWSRFGYAPSCARWLNARCRSAATRPDIIHIHGVYSHLTQAAARIAAQHEVPYVIRPAGSLDTTAMKLRNAWAKRLVIRASLHGQLRRAAFVHATSEDEAASIRSGFPDAQVFVVPHGVSIPDAPSSEARRAWYARFPQLAGQRQLLFMSRLHMKKQPELLVRALPALQRKAPGLMLVLAGPDAGHREAIELEVRRAGVEGSVVFAGFLHGDMKHAAFGEAAVFALPSKHENYGFAVVEAMAHGKPILVSPHVATHEFVDAAAAGLTVPDTVADVTSGLATILQQDGAAMGNRGRAYVREHLSWSSVARRLTSHYGQAIRGERESLSLESSANPHLGDTRLTATCHK